MYLNNLANQTIFNFFIQHMNSKLSISGCDYFENEKITLCNIHAQYFYISTYLVQLHVLSNYI